MKNNYLIFFDQRASYYCAECKTKTFYATNERYEQARQWYDRLQKREMNLYEGIEQEDDLSIVCPACQHDGADRCIIFYYNDLNPLFFDNLHIKYEDGKIKIYFYYHVVTLYSNKLQEHQGMSLLVMNLNTGRSTLLRPIDPEGNPFAFFGDATPIRNVTYGITRAPEFHFENLLKFHRMILTKVNPFIEEKMTEKLGYAFHLPYHQKNGYAYTNLLSCNCMSVRFHGLDYSKFSRFFHSVSFYTYGRFRKRLSQVSFGVDNQLEELFVAIARQKLPKAIRKMVLNDYTLLEKLAYFPFVHQSSNLMKILKENNYFSPFDSDITPKMVTRLYKHYVRVAIQKEKEKPNPLPKQQVINKVETIFCSRFSSIPYSMFQDMVYQYDSIIQRNPSYQLDTSLNFKELHDVLSILWNQMRHENIVVSYKEKELLLEEQINEFSFVLPKDTHELKNIGSFMRICVGSYDKRLLDRNCLIVAVKQADKYVGCIELSGNGTKVFQTKTHSNRYPEGALRESILTWIDHHELRIHTTDISKEEETKLSPIAV